MINFTFFLFRLVIYLAILMFVSAFQLNFAADIKSAYACPLLDTSII